MNGCKPQFRTRLLNAGRNNAGPTGLAMGGYFTGINGIIDGKSGSEIVKDTVTDAGKGFVLGTARETLAPRALPYAGPAGLGVAIITTEANLANKVISDVIMSERESNERHIKNTFGQDYWDDYCRYSAQGLLNDDW